MLARRVPFIFWNFGMQMLQQSDKIVILYIWDHEVRYVRMNQSHPAKMTPSWYGDSVGRYEGDTLAIDTVESRPIGRLPWWICSVRPIQMLCMSSNDIGCWITSRTIPTIEGSTCNSTLRSRTKESSQHRGPRP